ncbi:MAG TPA: D-amino acid aminotransferase [Rhodocyclaceae bacterium]|nr:MAG: D-amino acid aminotransferase [Betaproteobacteria bacterium CG2_30_68_42]PIX74921.1 MAG: D-amino acid aminotransferase [Rhodocyclales bacterium CG_4_10_14_3_um_filter_68_10]PJA57252.1 MAG: D-amino acid aminotransferase [Rhodocyclales bacterium CG_4_9_14_3_um_filter_68_10]HCX32181.1 D-amino acid aminotransferase [Rhodocyclaceae bacterium]
MTVYLNGEFMPRAEARVPAMDRGFLFGDGAYEVVPVYSRRPFRLEEHLRRLERTLEAIRLPDPLERSEWSKLVLEVIARNAPEDQSVYVQVSRGADMSKRNHAFPEGVAPTVFVMSEPLHTPPPDQIANGVGAISAADFRWLRCDLKTVSLLGNCLLRQLAVDAGCAETILLRDGFLTEGAASNIFVVREGVLAAPPRSHLMLTGITYDVVLELAVRHGMAHEVREILESELRRADEIWITSSTKEVLPVTALDGKPVGAGRPGPLFARMYGWYQQFKTEVMRRGR